jgi:hypothetical protein
MGEIRALATRRGKSRFCLPVQRAIPVVRPSLKRVAISHSGFTGPSHRNGRCCERHEHFEIERFPGPFKGIREPLAPLVLTDLTARGDRIYKTVF